MGCDRWGIFDGYHDVSGEWHTTDPTVVQSLRASLGAPDELSEPPEAPAIRFIREGTPAPIDSAAALVLEDGTGLRVDEQLPPDLPPGYHDLYPHTGSAPIRLIVTPANCVLPRNKAWGWAVQAYSLRSSKSWGHGDLGAVGQLAATARTQGAAHLLLSPITSPGPGLPQTASPYSPSSRLWRNPLLIELSSVPGVAEAQHAEPLGMAALGAAGRSLGTDALIDHDRAWELKRTALAAAWACVRGRALPDFRAWRARQGPSLELFATHDALAEHHRSRWLDWPIEFRKPESSAVARFAAAHRDLIDFHAWLQWLLDQQINTVSERIGLIHDLPVGISPDGADAWAWHDLLATGVTIGAPPDEFNPAGQDWGLAAFNPWALRSSRFEPFVAVLRAAMRSAVGIRIDHVMGIFRLFLRPADASAEGGAYVRFPASELLDLIALESQRAGAFVIGEDLGTVEPGVREELAARQVLSTKLVLFEDEPPSRFPAGCLAALTTHDLPTVTGLSNGSDANDRNEAGVSVDIEADASLMARVSRTVAEGMDLSRDDNSTGDPAEESPSISQCVVAAHRALAHSPALIVIATLEDALGVAHRPNLPGTTVEHPNWRQTLPVTSECLDRDDGMRENAAALQRPIAGDDDGGARSGT